MSQFARPSSTTNANGWTIGGGAASLHAATSDSNDATYAIGPTGSSAELIMGLSSVTDPTNNVNHLLRVRAKVQTGASGAERLTFYLYEGTTLRASSGATNISRTTITDYDYTLTTAEADAITNYANLVIRIAQTTIGATEIINVYDTFLSVDNATTVVGGSFTAGATVRRPQAGSVTAGSVIKAPMAGSKPADAAIKRTQVPSPASSDATVRRITTVTPPADAVVKAPSSGSRVADAVVQRTQSPSGLSLDAVILRTSEDGFSADAWLASAVATIDGSLAADAIVSTVGRCVWVSPPDGDPIGPSPTLVFTMPAARGKLYFHMQLDTVDTFDGADLRDVTTIAAQTGWEYWDGGAWQAVPSDGVPNTYSGNQARYTVQSPLQSGTWYRRVRAGTN